MILVSEIGGAHDLFSFTPGKASLLYPTEPVCAVFLHEKDIFTILTASPPYSRFRQNILHRGGARHAKLPMADLVRFT